MKKKLPKFLIRLVWFGASLTVLWLSIVLIYVINIPDVEVVRGCFKTSMFGVDLCSQSPNYVPLKEVSPILVQAIVLSEDASFYAHNGFDWFEIQSAFNRVLDDKGRARGASTITQQLAKNLFLSSERSLVRKLREAYITIQLERILEKNEILEKYLNVVEFGPNLYGLKKASQYYFKKHPRDLNLLESAYLASLLPNPKDYAKSFPRKKLSPYLRERIRRIIERVHKHGKISSNQAIWAKEQLDTFPWHSLQPPPDDLEMNPGDDELLSPENVESERIIKKTPQESPDTDYEVDVEGASQQEPTETPLLDF